MAYAKIDKGTIVGVVRNLPKNTKHISGFDKLPLIELKKHGYFPLEEIRPDYDPSYQRLDGPVYEVLETKVRAVYTAVDTPLETAIHEKVNQIRKEAGVRTLAVSSIEERLLDLEKLARLPANSPGAQAIKDRMVRTESVWTAATNAINEVETATSAAQAAGVVVAWPE